MNQSSSNPTNNPLAILSLTIFSVYFHVCMEWLFFVTKPSELSAIPFFEQVKVLLAGSGIIALLLIAGLLLISIPALLVRNPKWKGRLQALRFVPALLMLSITALILLDNFTYTVFKFGIVTTTNAWRMVYIVILIIFLRWMFRFTKGALPKLKRSASFLSGGLFALSWTVILVSYFSQTTPFNGFQFKRQSSDRPNIIILGADGLSASYLSVYGYKTDTTPFLTELAKTSLIAENAFSNASSTTASTTSALTGKEPAEINVYRYPDVLTNDDSFEHLPAILKGLGYKTVEIGTPYYVDAEKLNLLNGFDIVNNKSMEQPVLDALRVLLGNSPSTQFIQIIVERSTERLLHIFFLEDMQNPFEAVNNPKVRMTDAERVEQIIDLLDTSNRPVFVFAHFMNTHGPAFSSEQASPSESSSDHEEDWDVDLYIQAIQSFDEHVREIYTHLIKSGKLDNTIILIYTDHGYKYAVNQRIPILIHFPKNENKGLRRNNVEIIDIPVTLLDYLDIPHPEWMTGWSMLGEEPPADRRIVSIIGSSPRKVKPPFYQIKTVQVIVCQKWYALNVQENIWGTGIIKGHTSPCANEKLPPDTEIRDEILKYLDSYGYDVSSLQ